MLIQVLSINNFLAGCVRLGSINEPMHEIRRRKKLLPDRMEGRRLAATGFNL